MVQGVAAPALLAELERILDRFEAGADPGPAATSQPATTDDGASWPLVMILILAAVLVAGGAAVWIAIRRPGPTP